MAKNDLYIRSFSGLIFLAIVVCTTMWGFFPLLGLIGFISTICLYEFLKIRGMNSIFNQIFVYTSNGVMLLWGSGVWPEQEIWFMLILTGIIFIWFLITLFLKALEVMETVSGVLFSLVYISLPFALFAAFSHQETAYNPQRPLLVFILVWASDTFAYVAGRLFGRTYLFPALSPKKTVEGWIGGTVLAAVAGGLLSNWWSWLNLVNGMVLGTLVSIFGTAGDLFESALKRRAGVKDSGRIMPGHGGLLDRFDAFLFAAVIVYVWFHFYEKLCVNY